MSEEGKKPNIQCPTWNAKQIMENYTPKSAVNYYQRICYGNNFTLNFSFSCSLKGFPH